MKITRADAQPIVVGKRVTMGAAINSMVLAVSYFYPEHAQAMLAMAIPLTFLAQILVAQYLGVTTHDEQS